VLCRARVIEKKADVGVERPLVPFERQRIIATLIHDLPGNVALALSASTVTMVPFNASISSSLGTAVISFDFSSVAICARTSR
jgi:hypothetical protein